MRAETTWRSALSVNLVSGAIVTWYGARYLWLSLEARGRVAALLSVPPWPLYVAILALAAAGAALGIVLWLRKAPPSHQALRLVPVLAVLVLALHVFAIPPYTLPFPAEEIVRAQLASLDRGAFTAPDDRLAADPASVERGLDGLSPPFVGEDGRPLGHWKVEVRQGCAGATGSAGAVRPGTVIYCLSPDRMTAWLSAVGLDDAPVGRPAIVAETVLDLREAGGSP